MFSGTVPAAVNGEVESIKKKFGNTFPDIEIASALKINNMDAEQSTEFLRELEPFVEVKRKGRGRNKKMVPENHVQQQQEAVAQMYPLAPLSHQPEPFLEVKRKGRGRNKKMVPENQVQQQQEAVAQMHPLAHLSHQPGDNVAIDIPQTEDSCSTSPAPAPTPTPSDMPSSLGSAASLPPSLPGPPPPPAAPHLSPIQDHYWTVIDKDELVQFLNLSSSQVLQACLLDASELATISCVDIKYPSYVLPTIGGYSIVILPDIFCIIGQQRSYIRHEEFVEHSGDPLAYLAQEIASAWPGGEGFDLHVMERVFSNTLQGLRDEKDTLDLSSSGGMTQVAFIETFIGKNINVKQAAENASRIFREREGVVLCTILSVDVRITFDIYRMWLMNLKENCLMRRKRLKEYCPMQRRRLKEDCPMRRRKLKEE